MRVEKLTRHIPRIEIWAVAIFIVLVAAYTLTDWFTAQEAAAFGTLVLALATFSSVYHNRKQTEFMREELEFIRRPQLHIHYDSEGSGAGGPGLLVFENTGQVPIKVSVSFSLAAMSETEDDDPILDPEKAYADLPDRVKIFHGAAGDWGNNTLFLEPGESNKYDYSMLRDEILGREPEYIDDQFFWLRADCVLESEVTEDDRREVQRLFKIGFSDDIFSSAAFSEARNQS